MARSADGVTRRGRGRESARDLHAFDAHRLRPRWCTGCRTISPGAVPRGDCSSCTAPISRANHLEAGVGTGFFLDRAGGPEFDRLVLLDINRNCLDRAARRLDTSRPEPSPSEPACPDSTAVSSRFDSVGLTYVLHCLPGRLKEKLQAVDHLSPLMGERAVLFGATILGRGIAPNAAARTLLDLYNAKGVFNNREDDFESLSEGLRRRFGEVEIERQGCVALFRAARRPI